MEGLIERYAGRTVLVLGAHPDDGEVGAGGTVARLTRAKAKVLLAAVSAPQDMEKRAAEARAAAEVLRAEPLLIVNDRPCRLEDLKTSDLVARIDALMCEYRPSALFTHARDETHWDHFLLSRAVLGSMRLGPCDVFLFNNTAYRNPCQAWRPNLWIDVTATIGAKLEAIASHESQFAARGKDASVFREIAKAHGRVLGTQYAEAFEILRLNG
ncbi:MAG: PIG-L deacetylase family protein [Myxococcales bacterium]|jgi:LmbE family N-acetylglucosaminyl deacetylase